MNSGIKVSAKQKEGRRPAGAGAADRWTLKGKQNKLQPAYKTGMKGSPGQCSEDPDEGGAK